MQDFQKDTETSQTATPSGTTPPVKTLKKAFLINKLNYINFQDGCIQVVFEHAKYSHALLLNAKPLPCLGESLECIWPDGEAEAFKQISSYKFKELQINNGKNVIIVKPSDVFINGKSANFLLPETCHELTHRQTRRYPCQGIDAQIIQNGITFKGSLGDFNRSCFRVEIHEQDRQAFNWIHEESNLNLLLTNERGMIFAGECKISQIRNGQRTRKNFIIEPLNLKIKRFASKDFRATRYQLVPSPYIIFTHPFSRKKKALSIIDISGSGFSVKEDQDSAMLVPGMIIPDIEIHLANSFQAKCKAQVVYRSHQNPGDRGGFMKAGLAILDMDIEDHGKILSLLHQAQNPHLYLDGQVNEDDLWRFFFETGFIYPGKYMFMKENKEGLRALYNKIYSDSKKIAKHFIYRDHGEILAHIAIIRFYRKSWMIQHHASYRNTTWFAGIEVLDQMGRFVNESGNMLSMNMDFVFCYYRSDNKFPNQLFGGAARNIKEPTICSEDSFAYFHYKNKENKPEQELKPPWKLERPRSQDLIELKRFYHHISGGVLIEALELTNENELFEEIGEEYEKLGLKREKHLFCLKKDNNLAAVFLVNLADTGLNFSDITNSIHTFIVEEDILEPEILELAFLHLSRYFSSKEIPVLLFPCQSAEKLYISYEKIYKICALNAKKLDFYLRYIKTFFKRLNSIQARQEGMDEL